MKNLHALFFSVTIVAACGPDIQSENANSFVSQIRFGMSTVEYKVLRDRSYPSLTEGTVIGSACKRQDDGNQSCNPILLGPDRMFSLAYTHEELAADCAKFTCYPSDLADILFYDPNTGLSDEMADSVVLRIMNWGSWDGQMAAYVFADSTRQRLIGLMLEGEFEDTAVQFPE